MAGVIERFQSKVEPEVVSYWRAYGIASAWHVAACYDRLASPAIDRDIYNLIESSQNYVANRYAKSVKSFFVFTTKVDD
jgi:hypothetical protein